MILGLRIADYRSDLNGLWPRWPPDFHCFPFTAIPCLVALIWAVACCFYRGWHLCTARQRGTASKVTVTNNQPKRDIEVSIYDDCILEAFV